MKATCVLVLMVSMITVTEAVSAAIVTNNLVLSLDAGNAGNGVGVLGSGNAWINQSGSATNHDATLVGTADWAGTGTALDPFVVQFRSTPGAGTASGYATVVGSTPGSDLDLSTSFTYEVWAKIVGSGSGSSYWGGADGGTLMSHSSYSPEGNGSISYNPTAHNGAGPGLYDAGGSGGANFPNSTGPLTDGLMHHIVLSRAGGGINDTAWYLDGVLQSTFQSSSSPTDDTNGPYPFTIGARTKWFTTFDTGANADIAQVRVYSAALTADEVQQNFNSGLTSVPEPEAVTLMAFGLIGLLVITILPRKRVSIKAN
ncbi:MAG: LamG domain-containing protein [Pirellulales bacterium]|nr:LamG domain-containing protein [Pirellulales bacterium]